MLSWVNTLIPERKVANFTTDWNNGLALCSLVDRIQPGLCPQHGTLKPSNGLENCQLGMGLAADHLDIPQIIKPEHLNHPEVDEMSVMTYISYFCKPSITKLLAWVQSKIPHQNVTNFKTDWNNGITLAALIEAISPGLFPNWSSLDPHDSLGNLTKGIDIAEKELGVEPVLKADAMADPSVDELNVVTYITRFLNAKAVPLPNNCVASGPGLSKGFVKKEAIFQVDASKGGVGKLVVKIKSPSGTEIDAKIAEERSAVYKVSYIPIEAGANSIIVQWEGLEISGSPFTCNVVDPGSVSFTGPEISEGRLGKVGKLVVMVAKGVPDVTDLSVTVDHVESGKSEPVSVSRKGSNEAECSYTPSIAGKDRVIVKVSSQEIPGSPFGLSVVDPSKCSVSLIEPAAGQAVILGGQPAVFSIQAKGSADGILVETKTPSKTIPVSTTPNSDGTLTAKYSPLEIGSHTVTFTCAGEPITGSPLSLMVVDPKKITFFDPIPKYCQVGKEITLNMSAKDAGGGTLETVSSSQGTLTSIIKKLEGGLYALNIKGLQLGSSDVSITWSGHQIPLSPFTVNVCDASKCSAFGKSLSAGQGKVEELFEFTVQAKNAGVGELEVNSSGPLSSYAADIKDNKDGTYGVSFTSYDAGLHKIEIKWGGEPIPNSPYQVTFVKMDASQFVVRGDGLTKCIAKEKSEFILIGPEAGLIEKEGFKVSITGQSLSCSVVPSIPPISADPNILISYEDQGGGNYLINYAIPKGGNYNISITCFGQEISGSPYDLHALPAPDAEKCKVFGKAIDSPNELVIGKALEFKVDTTNAGTGSLTAVAFDPLMKVVPIFLGEEKGTHNERIHLLKIDPQYQGKHTFEIKWSEQHITGSPFKFDVGDPSKVIIVSIPDQETFVAKVGEPIEVIIDASHAGPGKLTAAAKLPKGTEPFKIATSKDGRAKCTFIPQDTSNIELILTYSDVNILPAPWSVEVVNPNDMTIVPPKGYGRVGDYVTFHITGMNKSNAKKTTVKATHEKHSATVKQELGKDGITAVRFTPKMTGKYTVEAICGQRHIQGSPFTVFVCDPNAVKFASKIPSVIAVGKPIDIAIDTSNSGPGNLTTSIGKDECIKCVIDEVSRPAMINVVPTAIGSAQLTVYWAEYPITGTPFALSVVDPSKCTFRCPQLQDRPSLKENEQVEFIIDIAQCGPCTPEVVASGEKAVYKVSLKDNKNGTFTASFSPWQTGKTNVKVLIGGREVPNSPLVFDVLKQISLNQVTVTGEGYTQAIQNQKVSLNIHGLDVGSLERKQLTYKMTYTNGGSQKAPQLECIDNKNGTYTLTYKASDIGECKLCILYEGKDIPRSPFTVVIKPEPRADKCVVSGKVLEPGAYLNIKDQAQIVVDSTAGGSGELTVMGKQPDGRNLTIYTSMDKSGDHKLHNLIFDAPKVGVYSVAITWEGVPLSGSPFEVRAVDPTRCIMNDEVPETVQLNQSVTLGIDTTGAGAGEMTVLFDGNKTSSDIVTADVVKLGDMDETQTDKYQINFIGKSLGEVSVVIQWGGFPIQKTPFKLSSCDSSACVFDAEQLSGKSFQVGVPFHIKVDSKKAGKAKLQVKPDSTSTAQYTIDIQSVDDIYTASITPWTVGEQILVILWGQEEVTGSPVKFTVCDPKKCKITGLPDPSNYIPVLGEKISFSIDYSEAGPGEPTFVIGLADGTEEEIEGEVDGKVVQYSYAPEEPGSLKILLEFNHINLLPIPWDCEVPDPTKFRTTPPKGMAKLNEPVKFLITGVTKETENFSITAMHPDHTAPITTEHGNEGNTIIAYFTPTAIGEYLVHVKHSTRDIDGSPFFISVADPDGIAVDGTTPTGVFKVGEEIKLQVNATAAGPGDLTCALVPLSGDLQIEPQIISSPDDEGLYEVTFQSGSIGTCELELRWAEYLIKPSPCTICFVDPSKVIFSSKELESDATINQGEALQFVINGAEAGQGVPEIKVIVVDSPDKTVAQTLQDNQDGTFLATVTPWFSGIYHVIITWSGYAIREGPIQFEVHKMIDSRGITAHGDGLKSAIAGRPLTVVINAAEPGLVERGMLVVKCYDPAESKEEEEEEEDGEEGKETVLGGTEQPTTQWKDNDDGTYDLTICYPYEAEYVLSIDYNEQPIYQSPFTVNVKGAPSAEMCIISGPSVERLRKGLGILLTQQVEIQVDSTAAGSGELQYIATDPSGETVAIFSHQEDSDGKQIHFLRFSPFDVGTYIVKLYWSNVPLPNTPLEFIIVDPTRCLVQGLPIPNNGAVQMGETISYSIAPSNCGIDTPKVTITTRHDNTAIDLEGVLTEEVTDAGVYVYHQSTSEPNNYYINVTLGGIHIPGSPFKCDVVDPTQFALCGLTIEGKYAYVGDTVSFQIQGIPPDGEVFSVIAHGPHNDQVCTVYGEEGFYECSFPVIDAGSYEVYVECANKHLPGSPFQINVADPSKCQVLEFPTELQVGVQESVIVKTGEAGMGELQVLVNDEETSSALTINIEQVNTSTYSITLDPQYVSDVRWDIRWAGKTIPQFPLQLNICDASQCKVFGQALVAKRGKVGEAIVFTVVTHRAGMGKLVIKATGPSAQYTITPEQVADGKYEAQFIPWQIGPHVINIFWGKTEIPKSPFSLHIDKGSGSDTTCHATGDGLRKAIANRPAQFMLFSGETGLVEKGELIVMVKSALHGESIGVKVKDENNGSYQVTYVPPNRGAYLATVIYHEEPIPGSPFKINCVAGPDASKCHINGLHQNTLYIVGKPIEFTVDTSEAGHGQLKVYVQGPRDSHPKVYTADNSKGLYSVKFDALIPGRYFIVVAWSDQHIPGSPFKIRVHPGPDASKVIVSGPGIKDSLLGEDSQLLIDTKEAGIGTLLIRVHGIKDAFKIQADPISESEPRILQATYSPTLPGSYDIFIRWSGVHVPGSPFKVHITKPGGGSEEEELATKVETSRKVAQLKRKARRDATSTDEEGSTTGAERSIKQRVVTKKKTNDGGMQQSEVTRKAVLKRSQSSVPSLGGGGPIKPSMKMKKNPSMSQIQTPGKQ